MITRVKKHLVQPKTKKIRAKDGYRPILNDGKLVTDKSVGNYIAGILCENLVACKNKAAQSIKNVGTANDTKRIYSISEQLDNLL